MKKILLILLVITMINIQGIMAQEKITQTSEADGKAAFQREMIFPIGEPNTAYAKYFIGNSYHAGLRGGQGLVSGGRQACRADASGRCHPHPGECEALAWSGG